MPIIIFHFLIFLRWFLISNLIFFRFQQIRVLYTLCISLAAFNEKFFYMQLIV